jgi:hypothetical protein
MSARQQELEIDQALHDFVAASERITAAQVECDEKLGQLESRISRVQEQRDRKLDDARLVQAGVAETIRAAGRGVPQIADLLALPERSVRQLLRVAKASGPVRAGRLLSQRSADARTAGQSGRSPVDDRRDGSAGEGDRCADGVEGAEVAERREQRERDASDGGERPSPVPDGWHQPTSRQHVNDDARQDAQADQDRHGRKPPVAPGITADDSDQADRRSAHVDSDAAGPGLPDGADERPNQSSHITRG